MMLLGCGNLIFFFLLSCFGMLTQHYAENEKVELRKRLGLASMASVIASSALRHSQGSQERTNIIAFVGCASAL